MSGDRHYRTSSINHCDFIFHHHHNHHIIDYADKSINNKIITTILVPYANLHTHSNSKSPLWFSSFSSIKYDHHHIQLYLPLTWLWFNLELSMFTDISRYLDNPNHLLTSIYLSNFAKASLSFNISLDWVGYICIVLNTEQFNPQQYFALLINIFSCND